MDLKEYDKLRKKISVKDFEGNNKGLDSWLYRFSFVGNVGSIFFAYFLVYPSLLKAISINLVNGMWGTVLAFLFTNVFLIGFEIIKRYLIKNFSSDYVANNKKINPAVFGWFIVSIGIVLLSFYLSLMGSKDLASIGLFKNNQAETEMTTKKDSLSILFEKKKEVYEKDNNTLRTINNNLRDKLLQTPIEYRVIRNDYQSNIDKNIKSIEGNQNEVTKIDDQLKQRVEELKNKFDTAKANNKDEDNSNIILFIIIAIVCELIILLGVFFRENFEHTLYQLHRNKYEKIYQKRDRYVALLTFIYNDGKASPGDKVISGLELKELVTEKSGLPSKVVDEFLHEMDRLMVFTTQGKRRLIAMTFQEALETIKNLDNSLRILENLK